MTGDWESRLAPEQDRSLENGPQRAPPKGKGASSEAVTGFATP
jgi:hypothetical protein